MIIKEVPYTNSRRRPNPHARCSKCAHDWYPYQNENISLPLEVILNCPKCNEQNEFFSLTLK